MKDINQYTFNMHIKFMVAFLWIDIHVLEYYLLASELKVGLKNDMLA